MYISFAGFGILKSLSRLWNHSDADRSIVLNISSVEMAQLFLPG